MKEEVFYKEILSQEIFLSTFKAWKNYALSFQKLE